MMKKKLTSFLTAITCVVSGFSALTVSAESEPLKNVFVIIGEDAEKNFVIMSVDDDLYRFSDVFNLDSYTVEKYYVNNGTDLSYGDVIQLSDYYSEPIANVSNFYFSYEDTAEITRICSVYDEPVIDMFEYRGKSDGSAGSRLIAEDGESYICYTDSLVGCFEENEEDTGPVKVFYHYSQPNGINWLEAKNGDEVAMYTYNGYPTIPASITPLGDANLDGSLDVLDVIVLNRNIMGLSSLPGVAARSTDFGQADFNGDGVIDGTDSLGMMKRIVGLE